MKYFLIYISALTIIGLFSYFYTHEYRIYNISDNEIFTVNINETFTVKFNRDRSGECWHCWANEKQCPNIQLVKRESYGNIFSFFGFKDAGGVEKLVFKGTALGVDTAYIGNCCVDIPADSLDVYDYTNRFVVKVVE